MFPLSAAADQARMPVVVLSGFLGSGKTTLLNRLLKDARMADTAVAINEFGEVPLDQHLIDHGDDKTVVMANGCLCCNLAGDMEEAVMRIFSRRESGAIPHFARLIVEPSGLADPAPIAQAILRQPTLSRVMRLESIITVVDGVFGLQQLDAHPEARSQAAIADILVVSKGDLADTAALDGAVAQHQFGGPGAGCARRRHRPGAAVLACLPARPAQRSRPSRSGWNATSITIIIVRMSPPSHSWRRRRWIGRASSAGCGHGGSAIPTRCCG